MCKDWGEALRRFAACMGYTHTLQGQYHHRAQASQTQGQRPQGQPKQCDLQLQIQGTGLQWGVHRGNFKDPGGKVQKHLKEPSPIHAHNTQTWHSTSADNINILRREDQGLTRLIKESIYIGFNNPPLNRNIGKVQFKSYMGQGPFKHPRPQIK